MHINREAIADMQTFGLVDYNDNYIFNVPLHFYLSIIISLHTVIVSSILIQY